MGTPTYYLFEVRVSSRKRLKTEISFACNIQNVKRNMLKLLSIFGLSTTHETITWSDKPQRDPVYMTAKIYDKDATCSGSSSS